jgi:Ras-related protein Rab-1A
VNDKFSEDYLPTIGVDFAVKTINLSNNEPAKLQIWDTAGMEKFKTITACYINGCHVILVVYDCSNVQSFYNLGKHIETINKQVPVTESKIRYIVANKIDKQNLISMQEGRKFAESIGYQFAEVSAL